MMPPLLPLNFVAVDVETANPSPTSICSIGCVAVIDGEIFDSYYSLVRPTPNWFMGRFTQIHGLTSEETDKAPTFDRIWPKVLDFSLGMPFVAHNARFDRGCIRAACRHYGIDVFEDEFYCTLQTARVLIQPYMCASKALASLCKFYGINLKQHHNALADARACAEIALRLSHIQRFPNDSL